MGYVELADLRGALLASSSAFVSAPPPPSPGSVPPYQSGDCPPGRVRRTPPQWQDSQGVIPDECVLPKADDGQPCSYYNPCTGAGACSGQGLGVPGVKVGGLCSVKPDAAQAIAALLSKPRCGDPNVQCSPVTAVRPPQDDCGKCRAAHAGDAANGIVYAMDPCYAACNPSPSPQPYRTPVSSAPSAAAPGVPPGTALAVGAVLLGVLAVLALRS